MHELALTEGILSIVSSEQKKGGFSRVLEIRLSVGEYSGVIPSCIEEYFPLVAKDTVAEGAKLTMETVPAEFECQDCGFRGRLPRRSTCCPECGSTEIRMIKGREFYVQNLVVE